MRPRVVLAIAGTDSSGGAGLAADLATFAALGVHGTCVVTAVTAQDTTGVHEILPIPPRVVAAQLDAVLTDLRPDVIKTGMLGTPETVRLVAQRCKAASGIPLVIDPVLRATTGADLASEAVVDAYREHLLPIATVLTPNADEDARLAHRGTRIVTGSGERPDMLHRPGRPAVELAHPPVRTDNDHGTGCTYASALAAHLALGADLPTAAARAADFVTTQLRRGSTWNLGTGRGPIAHTIGGNA